MKTKKFTQAYLQELKTKKWTAKDITNNLLRDLNIKSEYII